MLTMLSSCVLDGLMVCLMVGFFLEHIPFFCLSQIKDILKPEVMEEIVLETRQRLLEQEGWGEAPEDGPMCLAAVVLGSGESTVWSPHVAQGGSTDSSLICIAAEGLESSWACSLLFWDRLGAWNSAGQARSQCEEVVSGLLSCWGIGLPSWNNRENPLSSTHHHSRHKAPWNCPIREHSIPDCQVVCSSLHSTFKVQVWCEEHSGEVRPTIRGKNKVHPAAFCLIRISFPTVCSFHWDVRSQHQLPYLTCPAFEAYL